MDKYTVNDVHRIREAARVNWERALVAAEACVRHRDPAEDVDSIKRTAANYRRALAATGGETREAS